MNLNLSMHRIYPVDESDLDARQAERESFVPHEHPPKPVTRGERIGHKAAHIAMALGLLGAALSVIFQGAPT